MPAARPGGPQTATTCAAPRGGLSCDVRSGFGAMRTGTDLAVGEGMILSRSRCGGATAALMVICAGCSAGHVDDAMLGSPNEAGPSDSGGGGAEGSSGCSSLPSAEAGAVADSGGPEGGRRFLPPAVLARRALCYSGYRVNEDPTTTPPTFPTAAEVTSDLKLFEQGGWTLLRLFDCGEHASTTLKAIRDNKLDIRVMQGVEIDGPKATNDADNQAEIQRCLALNATYGDIIVAFSVGNELLDAWAVPQCPPGDLTGYIQEVRTQVSQPVTTDDFGPPFEWGMDTLPDGGPYSYVDDLQVAQAVDFLAVHVYPFLDAPYQAWDYQQLSVPEGPQRAVAMMKAAQAYNESQIADLRQGLAVKGLDIPIVIGESGWKSKPDPGTIEVSMGHPVNQKMFYDLEMAWVYGCKKDANTPLTAFFFEGNDEPWKSTDDGWGLFDTNRFAKYVVWDQFPNLLPPGSPMYTQADAVYYKAGDPTTPPP